MQLVMSQEAAKLATETRERYEELLDFLTTRMPHSRHRSVAITELETSMMWAVRAVIEAPGSAVPATQG